MAQIDIPQPLAIIVITLIAVLPEYAVDMYFHGWLVKNLYLCIIIILLQIGQGLIDYL
ncbi:hypothetical protein K9U34_02515 [Lawsonia intracellularis]|uniref:hypothetical protein n=1 Tax=Lawsonia intracellularis TaxID=29546 RepID=UPI0012DD6F7D|nr:hypothetical protein [Lawsonia intracellularis]MBZ3892471.1 hypothetical protein [Lawsonia intracellularis]UYH53015.1 hypothetical protein OCT60_00470 [Lawsonia intracellularis]